MSISIKYEKTILPNGLEVITHVDKNIPVTAVNVWYHVGSKNEELGKTGFAHLFEHVMFEGSKNHNKDYFAPLQKVGAKINGSTTNDRTNYWEDIPSNSLELALWLESDRMGFLTESLDQARFDLQRDVVKNERRQSYVNRPYGMAYLQLQESLFPFPHPYNWPTIGSQKDLDAANIDDVKLFFKKYYHPSNASIVIAGDIDPIKTLCLVEKYFGDLPSGPSIQRLKRSESGLNGESEIIMEDSVQLPRLYLAWPTIPDLTEQQPALDMLSLILAGGRSSRLEKLLVYDTEEAYDISAFHHGQEICGEFHVIATGKPGKDLQYIKTSILNQISKIIETPPTNEELQRAFNKINALYILQLEKTGGFGGKADQLNYYNVMAGNPDLINTDIDRYKKITPENISKAAKLLGINMVSLQVLPKKEISIATSKLDRTNMPKEGLSISYSPPLPQNFKVLNNINVLFIKKSDLPIIHFGILMNSGAVSNETNQYGLAKFATEMLSEGSINRSSQQISEELEYLAYDLQLDTTRNSTFMSISGLTDNLSAGIDILSDIIENPSFPQKEMDRLKNETKAQIISSKDNADKIASTAIRSILYGSNTPLGHPIDGTAETVDQYDNKNVRNYHKHLIASKAAFIVVGDTEKELLIEQIESKFKYLKQSDLRRKPANIKHVEINQECTIYIIDRPGAAQSVIRAGHLTIPRTHADYYALSFANFVLGGEYTSRINMNLRQDKGYSYGFYSSINWSNINSPWMISGSVETGVTTESVTEILNEVKAITGHRPIQSDEFKRSKDGLIKGIPSQFGSTGQLMSQLVRLEELNLPYDNFSKNIIRINALTIPEVNEAAKRHINPNRLSIIIVGDKEQITKGLESLLIPIVNTDTSGNIIN